MIKDLIEAQYSCERLTRNSCDIFIFAAPVNNSFNLLDCKVWVCNPTNEDKVFDFYNEPLPFNGWFYRLGITFRIPPFSTYETTLSYSQRVNNLEYLEKLYEKKKVQHE
jgi:hypothetical protein